jgi:flagellin
MSLTRVSSNIAALNATRNLNVTGMRLTRSLERLSTGLRVNRAGDDAAGLAISEKMRSQIRGMHRAIRNAQDGISLIQTAEGALAEVHNMLQRIRELAVQAYNGIYTDEQIDSIQDEVDQLLEEIERIANDTEFNTRKILDGSVESFDLQVGPNEGQVITIELFNLELKNIGGQGNDGDDGGDDGDPANGNGNKNGHDKDIKGNGHAYGHDKKKGIKLKNLDIDDPRPNHNSISAVDEAISYVSAARASLGAYHNRLEHTIANLGVSVENLIAAESRIRDADFAFETAEFTRNTILFQAGSAILAQANVMPQNMIALLV